GVIQRRRPRADDARSGAGGRPALAALNDDHRSTPAGQVVGHARRDDTPADHNESATGAHSPILAHQPPGIAARRGLPHRSDKADPLVIMGLWRSEQPRSHDHGRGDGSGRNAVVMIMGVWPLGGLTPGPEAWPTVRCLS